MNPTKAIITIVVGFLITKVIEALLNKEIDEHEETFIEELRQDIENVCDYSDDDWEDWE